MFVTCSSHWVALVGLKCAASFWMEQQRKTRLRASNVSVDVFVHRPMHTYTSRPFTSNRRWINYEGRAQAGRTSRLTDRLSLWLLLVVDPPTSGMIYCHSETIQNMSIDIVWQSEMTGEIWTLLIIFLQQKLTRTFLRTEWLLFIICHSNGCLSVPIWVRLTIRVKRTGEKAK